MAVRSFGFMPSLDLLRPGDVLLVSALKKPLVSRAIEKVQRKAGFDEWHAQWHHASVYVGNNLVCEAQLWGVRVVSVFKYTAGTHQLRFRRNPALDDLSSCMLALEAALKLKYGYNWRSILQLLVQAKLGWNGGSGKPRQLSDRATICSQLYADALTAYLSARGAAAVTAKLNGIYSTVSSKVDSAFASSQLKRLANETW